MAAGDAPVIGTKEKAVAGGVATLNGSVKLTDAQVPYDLIAGRMAVTYVVTADASDTNADYSGATALASAVTAANALGDDSIVILIKDGGSNLLNYPAALGAKRWQFIGFGNPEVSQSSGSLDGTSALALKITNVAFTRSSPGAFHSTVLVTPNGADDSADIVGCKITDGVLDCKSTVRIRDCHFDTASHPIQTYAIRPRNSANVHVDRCKFTDATALKPWGFRAGSTDTSGWIMIRDSVFESDRVALHTLNGASIDRVTITGCIHNGAVPYTSDTPTAALVAEMVWSNLEINDQSIDTTATTARIRVGRMTIRDVTFNRPEQDFQLYGCSSAEVANLAFLDVEASTLDDLFRTEFCNFVRISGFVCRVGSALSSALTNVINVDDCDEAQIIGASIYGGINGVTPEALTGIRVSITGTAFDSYAIRGCFIEACEQAIVGGGAGALSAIVADNEVLRCVGNTGGDAIVYVETRGRAVVTGNMIHDCASTNSISMEITNPTSNIDPIVCCNNLIYDNKTADQILIKLNAETDLDNRVTIVGNAVKNGASLKHITFDSAATDRPRGESLTTAGAAGGQLPVYPSTTALGTNNAAYISRE